MTKEDLDAVADVRLVLLVTECDALALVENISLSEAELATDENGCCGMEIRVGIK